jgi:hypothetical protein
VPVTAFNRRPQQAAAYPDPAAALGRATVVDSAGICEPFERQPLDTLQVFLVAGQVEGEGAGEAVAENPVDEELADLPVAIERELGAARTWRSSSARVCTNRRRASGRGYIQRQQVQRGYDDAAPVVLALW